MTLEVGSSFVANLYYTSAEGERPIDYEYPSRMAGAWLELRETSGRSQLRPLLAFHFKYKRSGEGRHFYEIRIDKSSGFDEPVLRTSINGYLGMYHSLMMPGLAPEWKIQVLEEHAGNDFSFWLRNFDGQRVARHAEEIGGTLKEYLNVEKGEEIIIFRARNVRYR